jgi:hypothetical protein
MPKPSSPRSIEQGPTPPPGTWTLDDIIASGLFEGVPRETLRVKLRPALTGGWWKRRASDRTPLRLYSESEVRALRSPVLERWRRAWGPQRRQPRKLDLGARPFRVMFPLPQAVAGALPDRPPPGFAEPVMIEAGIDRRLREQPDWRRRVVNLGGPQLLGELEEFAGPQIGRYAPVEPIPCVRFKSGTGRRPLAFHVERARAYLAASRELEDAAALLDPKLRGVAALHHAAPWFPFLWCGLRFRGGRDAVGAVLCDANETLLRHFSDRDNRGRSVRVLLLSEVQRFWDDKIEEAAADLPGRQLLPVPCFDELGLDPSTVTLYSLRLAIVRWLDQMLPWLGDAALRSIAKALIEVLAIPIEHEDQMESASRELAQDLQSGAAPYSGILITGRLARR